MRLREALRELGAALAAPEFRADPLGVLGAWARVVRGIVDPDRDVCADPSGVPLGASFDEACARMIAKLECLPAEDRRQLEALIDDMLSTRAMGEMR